MEESQEDIRDVIRPLVCGDRGRQQEGLWVAVKKGVFQEGDEKLKASHYVIGKVILCALGDALKVRFEALQLIRRNKTALDKSGNIIVEAEDFSGEEDKEKRRESMKSNDIEVKGRNRAMPRLYVYLTHKKPKKRIRDLEETSNVLPLDGDRNGCIFTNNTTSGTFEQKIPRRTLEKSRSDKEIRGIVVAKPRNELPLTQEPVVYGYALLSLMERYVRPTDQALGLDEDLSKKGKKKMKKPAGKVDKNKKQTKFRNAEYDNGSHERYLRSLGYYKRLVKRAWEELHLKTTDEIAYDEFKEIFDRLNIIIYESRAFQLFNRCDLDSSGKIGMTEMETALMMQDLLPPCLYVRPQDVFISCDLDQSGSLDFEEFMEAFKALGLPNFSEAQMKKKFSRVDADRSGSIDYHEFIEIWLECINVNDEIDKRVAVRSSRWLNFGKSKELRNLVLEEDQYTEELIGKAQRDADVHRREAREKRDQARREIQEGTLDARRAAKEAALLRRAKRERIKREQAEKAKRREEDMLHMKQLEIEKSKVEDMIYQDSKMTRGLNEKERVNAARKAGIDKLHASGKNLRDLDQLWEEKSEKEIRIEIPSLVFADLSRNRIRHLDDKYTRWMSQLRVLDVSENSLTCFPTTLDACHCLQVLDLRWNRISVFPETIHASSLRSLEQLYLQGNQLSDIPDAIRHLINLKVLLLDTNRLTNLPHGLSKLVCLERLQLSRNEIKRIEDGLLSPMTSMKLIDLSFNNLMVLPEDIGSLNELQYCYFHGNPLTMIPRSCDGLIATEVVIGSHCQLLEVGLQLMGWTSVVKLDLSRNQIQTVHASIGCLKKVQYIDLSNNLIETIPDQLGTLASLRMLKLGNNKLRSIPEELGALSRLEYCDLSANKLRGTLPDQIRFLSSLRELDLSKNHLTSVPISMAMLSNLQRLILRDNMIDFIPVNWRFFPNLRTLDLSQNRLRSLPMDAITNKGMPSLEVLDLSANLIESLPFDLMELRRLKHVSLKDNNLRMIPTETLNLVDILDISCNKFLDMPNRWDEDWNPSRTQRIPMDYTEREALAFARRMTPYEDDAIRIWNRYKDKYLSRELGLRHFSLQMHDALGPEWHIGLKKDITKYFFEARGSGMVPSAQMGKE